MLLDGENASKKHKATPQNIFIGLPAYNEEIAIERVLEKIYLLQDKLESNVIVVVYNDGSTDRTPDIAASWENRLNLVLLGEATNRGLGVGLSRLVQYAVDHGHANDLLVLMDCDDTHNPDQIIEMIKEIGVGNDVIIASRFRPNATVKGVPLHRHFMTMGAVLVFKTIYPVRGVNDYTCGYRCYRVSLLQQASKKFGKSLVKNAGFSCMVELLLKLATFEPRFKEIPLVLRYDLKPTESKMDVTSNATRLLKLLLIWKIRGFDNA